MKNKIIASKRFGKADVTKLLLALVFISIVFVPLIRMFTYMDGQSIQKVFGSPNFLTTVSNSLISAILGTVITVAVAFALSTPVLVADEG